TFESGFAAPSAKRHGSGAGDGNRRICREQIRAPAGARPRANHGWFASNPRSSGFGSPSAKRHEVERVMGIEPTLVAWEATVLPLNYTRFRPLMIPSDIRS